MLLLLFVLPFYDDSVRIRHSGATDSKWSHSDQKHWPSECTGDRQSPINIDKPDAIPRTCNGPRCEVKPILLRNYWRRFKTAPHLINKGYTVSMNIPEVMCGKKPHITGALLKGNYIAEELHFHWGSANSNGAEHTINHRRYKAEMHIVHRRDKNDTSYNGDGDELAVLAIFLEKGNVTHGLSKLFDKMTLVRAYHTETEMCPTCSLWRLLGYIHTKSFYTYRGSLTTPGCHETVSWIVLKRPMRVSPSLLSYLWNLRNEKGARIHDNYRREQPVNHRDVISFGGE
ncbi:maker236 [Drosophila busckii]|uniref:Maker236 n=1 Tax=Drosophila busckii TaxID=30019 RepID=A0A0M4F674_DROBS|nr:carbonic anhydrase 2 [Drosophila busckii]ALC47512.1 maker236 [Drosophila busckii]